MKIDIRIKAEGVENVEKVLSLFSGLGVLTPSTPLMQESQVVSISGTAERVTGEDELPTEETFKVEVGEDGAQTLDLRIHPDDELITLADLGKMFGSEARQPEMFGSSIMRRFQIPYLKRGRRYYVRKSIAKRYYKMYQQHGEDLLLRMVKKTPSTPHSEFSSSQNSES